MNKLTRIEELAQKLNQEILGLEVVQEYQKYEKLVLNDEKLKRLEKELKVLQKKIVNQKARQDDDVTKTIQEYQEKKEYYGKSIYNKICPDIGHKGSRNRNS